jgi:hypothetical protein
MRLRGGGNSVAEPQLGRAGAPLGPLRPPGGPREPGNLPVGPPLAGLREQILMVRAAVFLGKIWVYHRLPLGVVQVDPGQTRVSATAPGHRYTT